MNILAVESSCDETAVSVVRDGRTVLADCIASQVDLHRIYGGVVPEIASRMHIEAIYGLADQALEKANISRNDIDAIAVTYAPGLIGAVLVGVNFAKAAALALGKPLIPVHHIRGHIAANYIAFPELKPPFLCLVVSGGHTMIVDVKDYTRMEILGTTLDDAAGECFDKVARVLELGYPGGPKIDNLAKEGNEDAIKFKKVSFGKDNYDFSFSGIKTGVVNYIHNAFQKGEDISKADVAASFEKSVVEVLVDNLILASDKYGINRLALAGGVACNSRLRLELEKRKGNKDVFYPSPILCTDNGAMVACSAYYEYLSGNIADTTLNAIPFLSVELN